MALSDRDIIITPNRGASTEPTILFRGADATSSASINLKVYNAGNVGTLSFEGSSGQLLSITDSMSGSIFSVNDVSGIPSIEVFDTGEVRLAQYNGYVDILNSTPATSTNTGALQVVGGVGIGGNLYVGGTIYGIASVSGTISTATNIAGGAVRQIVYQTGVGTTGFITAPVTAGHVLTWNGGSFVWAVPGSANAVTITTTARTTNAAHYLTFVDSDNASATAETLYTTSSLVVNPSTGNAGVGTTTPQYKLDVNNANASIFQASFGSTISSGSISGIHFGYSEAGNQLYRKSAIVFERSDGGFGDARGKVHILNGPFGSSSATLADAKLTISSAGDIGIGVTSPEFLIDTGTLTEEFSTDKLRFNSYNGPAGGGSGVGTATGGGTSQGTGIIWKPNYTGYSKRSAGILNIGEGNFFRSGLAFYTNNVTDQSTDWTEAMRISSNGNVGIATASPAHKLVVAGGTYINGSLGVGTAPSGTTGEIRATNEITAYYSSDIRLKENIRLIADPIGIINQIRGVYYDWTDDHIKARGGEDGYFVRKHDIGVIAQEVEKVLPEIVAERDDGTKVVKYEKIVALLIEAVKSQQHQINQILEQVENLANK